MIADELSFCKLLAQMIKNSDMSNIEFYTKVGIKKPYFYDILKGKVNPPPPDRQFAMLRLLKSTDEQKAQFFDLAARERGEVPADIKTQLEKNSEIRETIRNDINYTTLLENGDNQNG